MTIERNAALRDFAARNGWVGITPTLLAGDASFRRYCRLRDAARTAVLMDAPPPQENVAAYVKVAGILRERGFSAPRIYAEDRARGFLLIEDFGDDTYTRLLARGADETELYTLAIDTLIALHRAVEQAGLPDLPAYDENRLLTELSLLPDWYAPALLGRRLADEARATWLALWREVLAKAALPRPMLVLRDYHVDNLMLLPDRPGVRACGLIDIQDAVIGERSYDLVSVLEDARRDVAPELRDAMTRRYLAAFPALDPAAFRRSAAILAAQRNSKIVGLFTRLAQRDGKPAYLAHLPRVWRLLDHDFAEPALAPIVDWLDRHLPASLRRVAVTAAQVSAA